MLLIPTKNINADARLPATKQYTDFSEIMCMTAFTTDTQAEATAKPMLVHSLPLPLPPFSQQATRLITY